MEAKISITSGCNARCATCPVWKHKPYTMRLADFKVVWGKLCTSNLVDRIMLNNTGDLYTIPNHIEYLQYIEDHINKPVLMTTNGELMDYVPAIDTLVISFNGGTKETYEATTGLPFESTVENIRAHYKALGKVRVAEIHCLMWTGNAGTEDALLRLWDDFPGRIRVSYKYDNQMSVDRTIAAYKTTERVPCDYLDKISVAPTGKVISCAHDFGFITDFGDLITGSVQQTMDNYMRRRKQAAHKAGEYLGICEKCNYNTPLGDRIRYIK